MRRRADLAVLFLIVAASGLAAQQRATVVTGGYVYDPGTKQPIVGATVRAIRSAYPGLPKSLHAFLPYRVVEHESAKTDERGRFRFRVPYGELVAFCAEHGSERTLVSQPVVAGGFVKLDMRGTREVSGRITRRDGKPVQGHEVQVYLPANAHQEFGLRIAARTDAAGRYRARLPVGTWVRVQARIDGEWISRDVHDNVINDFEVGSAGQSLPGRILGVGGRPLANCLVIHPSAPKEWARTDGSGDFQIVRRGAIGSVFAFPPDNHAVVLNFNPRQRTARVMPGQKISFRLVDRLGEPHKNAAVVVAGIAQGKAHRSGAPNWVVPRRYRTDEKGAVDVFTEKGCWFLAAFVEVDGRFVWFFRGAPQAGGNVGQLVVAPERRVTGQVVGPDRQPVADVDVHLVREPDDGSKLLPRELQVPVVNLPLSVVCRSGNAGRFHFAAVQRGKYRLVVRAPNCLPFSQRVVVDEEARVVRLELPEKFAVRGRVVGPGGDPVAGATVHVQAVIDSRTMTQEYLWLNRFGTVVVGGMTDGKGRFSFYGLPDQDVMCWVNGGKKWQSAQAKIPRRQRARIVMRVKPKL